MEGDDRGEAVLVAGVSMPAVVVERGAENWPSLGLDAGPLQREAVAAEAQRGDQGDVLAVAVVVVDRVAGRLGEDRAGQVLQEPGVAVDVVAFHLVGGGGDAPEEVVGKGLVVSACSS